MASLDFIFDLTKKLQKQDIDFLLITVQKGGAKSTDKVHVFDSISQMKSIKGVIEGIETSKDILTEYIKEFKKNKKNGK